MPIFNFTNAGFSAWVLPAMPKDRTVVERLRDIIRTATTRGARLTIRQISNMSDVNYERLWRFHSERSDTLPLDEAERIHKALTGRDLFTL